MIKYLNLIIMGINLSYIPLIWQRYGDFLLTVWMISMVAALIASMIKEILEEQE